MFFSSNFESTWEAREHRSAESPMTFPVWVNDRESVKKAPFESRRHETNDHAVEVTEPRKTHVAPGIHALIKDKPPPWAEESGLSRTSPESLGTNGPQRVSHSRKAQAETRHNPGRVAILYRVSSTPYRNTLGWLLQPHAVVTLLFMVKNLHPG